jgi:hypothetical protein
MLIFACHMVESMVMQIFISHGWQNLLIMFRNRVFSRSCLGTFFIKQERVLLQHYSSHDELPLNCQVVLFFSAMTSMQCSQSQPTVAFFFRVQSWTGFFLLSKQFIHNNNSLVVNFPMVILWPLWTQIRRSTLSRRKDPLFGRRKTTGLNCDLQTNWYFCSTYSVSMEKMDRGCPVFNFATYNSIAGVDPVVGRVGLKPPTAAATMELLFSPF